MGIIIPLILIFFSCLFIWRACDGFECASDYIGRNLSDGVKGATINAISSSIPELFTTLIALFVLSDTDGFAIGIGTTAGSSLFNGMIIPSLCILAVVGATIKGTLCKSVDISAKVILRDGLFLVAAEILFISILSCGQLAWWHGLFLMGFYAIYLGYMFLSMNSSAEDQSADEDDENDEDEDTDEQESFIGKLIYWLSLGPILDLERHFIKDHHKKLIKEEKWNGWPLLITSTVAIGVSCWLLVIACEWLGTGNETHPSYTLFGREFSGLGLPALFVAVIFAAMATSVPDTIISVRDAKKGEADDAVANALGSNIFDLCFALGFPLFVYTLINGHLSISSAVLEQIGVLTVSLLFLTIVTFLIFFVGARTGTGKERRIKLGKPRAFLLLGLYAIFVGFIVSKSLDAQWTAPLADFLSALFSKVSAFVNR